MSRACAVYAAASGIRDGRCSALEEPTDGNVGPWSAERIVSPIALA